jgi:hypothetical protein
MSVSQYDESQTRQQLSALCCLSAHWVQYRFAGTYYMLISMSLEDYLRFHELRKVVTTDKGLFLQSGYVACNRPMRLVSIKDQLKELIQTQ